MSAIAAIAVTVLKVAQTGAMTGPNLLAPAADDCHTGGSGCW